MFQATSDPSHPKCTRQTMGKDVINTVVARRNPTADGIRRPFLRLNVARDGTGAMDELGLRRRCKLTALPKTLSMPCLLSALELQRRRGPLNTTVG